MTLAIYEDNLMWSVRLSTAAKALGHEAVVIGKREAAPKGAKVAIVNLGSANFEPEKLVPELLAQAVVVIGHAGHKEKDLLALGQAAGCSILATNSELTHKFREILERAVSIK